MPLGPLNVIWFFSGAAYGDHRCPVFLKIMDRAHQCLKFTNSNTFQYLVSWNTFYLSRTLVLPVFLCPSHRFWALLFQNNYIHRKLHLRTTVLVRLQEANLRCLAWGSVFQEQACFQPSFLAHGILAEGSAFIIQITVPSCISLAVNAAHSWVLVFFNGSL